MKNGKEGVAREIMMGSPVTLKPEDTLDLANDVISLGRIRHIPVVDDGRLVGIITERDLIGAAAAQIFGLKQKNKSALLKSVQIKEVMKKRVISATPDTPIKEIAHLMAEKKIGCMPIMSAGVLVGLVTTTDILRYIEGLG
ncbi:MAG: CBS domain-containing protein [Deltaproteobacteria bacterium]|nr:CBS domain-containing protein [Deltaproteobacteria bacterium]